jgi:serine/threonine protein kinase
MALERGAFLYNRYRILEILGQGGMGSIYRAIDENLGVEVAVKENLFTTEEYARQFRREAVILANLRHVNLPRVSDHFVIDGQGQYLIMDYIEGDDLRERMDRDNVVPEMDMLDISISICDALMYMHTRKPPVLHRDIKPGNVKITSDEGIYLVDFGLAKVVHYGQQTSTGARAMTPGYSPPEQYGAARTDHRSDIYSLGATMYAALTGAIPEDSLARTMEQAELTPVRTRNPKITRRTASAIEKALEVHPDDRFQTAAEFKSELILACNASQPRAVEDDGIDLVSDESLETPDSESQTTPPDSDSSPFTDTDEDLPLPSSIILESESESLAAAASDSASSAGRIRGRSCLLTVFILIILVAASVGIAYLVDPAFPVQAYEEVSTLVVSILNGAEPLPITASNPSKTSAPGTITAMAEMTGNPILSQSPTKEEQLLAETIFPTPTASLTVTPTPTETATDTTTPTSIVNPTPTPIGGGYGQVAFASNRTGLPQIWLVNVDGTGLKQITEIPSGACQPDWSPDGKRLVFISPCKHNLETYIGTGLFLIDGDGSNLESFPIQGVGNYDPAWSPDGKKIAFTALDETERPQIWVRDLETGDVQLLSQELIRDYQPSYSPDGSQIIFVSTRQGPYQVWTMNPDGTNQERYTISGDLKNTNPALSPNGQLLVFTQSQGRGSIPRLKGVKFPDGAAQEFFLFAGPGYPMKEADFSSDGFWVAVESWPEGENHDIFIMSPNGTELTQLTFDPALDFDPAWRPFSP